jgi:hypothetical protein
MYLTNPQPWSNRQLKIAEGCFHSPPYSEEPDLTIYRIMQLDNERNILHLFAAARRGVSGSTDLLHYRDGAWEGTFRKLGTEIIDLALASERPQQRLCH